MKRAGIIFFIIIIIITGVIRLSYLMGPVDQNDNSLNTIKIEKGCSSYEIGEKLYNKNLIMSKNIFHILITITDYDKKLQAGYYEFSPSYSMWEIINRMVEGRIATFKVTIPEGYDIDNIIERLANKTNYKEQDFKKVIIANNMKREYLPADKIKYKFKLEGFLYPDTYIIPHEYSPKKIIETMLKQFEREWLFKLRFETEELDFNILEIMTIASLIENEAKIDKEKSIISAVIYNRLQKNMYLQIDAGIQYSIDGHKDKLLYKDLKIDSPYNTYLYRGLPPGPICSPGDEAIFAALNPADKDYLFYFALADGKHVFTKSYNEHLQLQQEIKTENQ